jgi:hypothetical protein
LGLEAPEIIEDKEVEIATALGIELLSLVLDKSSEVGLHEKTHRQHDIIDEMNKMIHEQHELILDIGNKRNEKSIKEKLVKSIRLKGAVSHRN